MTSKVSAYQFSGELPCPIPYQGSKRRLASRILEWFPATQIPRLIEPFAGSAAITLAAAKGDLASSFVIADALKPLTDIWKLIINDPELLVSEYTRLWNGQLDDLQGTYYRVRADYNRTGDPAKLLYLIARCVKNAVRFNPRGEFNQSPDNRRKGMRPEKMREEILAAHYLLYGRTQIYAMEYQNIIRMATPEDVVYMDPPYQGVSKGRDKRYFLQLEVDSFFAELEQLNSKEISYLLSFDGSCGTQSYGDALPDDLELKKVSIITGRSSQATLLGRNEITVESLYISPALAERVTHLSAPRRDASAETEFQLALLQ